MEKSSINSFNISSKSNREKLLEKRLISVNNQIAWLNKIKKTLEKQLMQEKARNL
jgi:hypothetical protein